MFVHPNQVERVLQRHGEITRARLVIDRACDRDRMVLRCEVAAGADKSLAGAVESTVREVCKLRAEVELVAPDALPQDGIVIEDARQYE